MSKKLILNSLSGTALYLINIVVAFIMSPVIIKILGNRDYGLWELVMSVIGYMGLLDLGIGPALVRFIAVADGKQDNKDLQQTISTAFAFFLVVGVLAVLCFTLLGYSPQIIAGSQTKNISNVGTVFLLLGVNAGLLFPLQVFLTTLMGLQRHYLINSTRGVLLILNALIAFYLLHRFPDKGLIMLALLEPVFTALQLILYVGAFYCIKSIPRIDLAAVRWSKMKELLTFGAKSITMTVASRLQNQSVPLIIGNVVGLSNIVYFVMPNRLFDYAKGLSQALGFPLTPYFSASIGKEAKDGLLNSWINTSLALQVVSLAMPLVISFYGEIFLALWIGQEYAVAGRWVIYILLIGLVADSLASNSFRILTAQSLHGRSAIVWLLLSALSIPIGIWGASQWGVVGVTFGTTFVMVIGNFVTMLMACSAMRISLATYFKKTALRLIVPLLIMLITLSMMAILVPAKNYADLLVQTLIACSIYSVAVLKFTLSSDVRKQLYDRVRLCSIPH